EVEGLALGRLGDGEVALYRRARDEVLRDGLEDVLEGVGVAEWEAGAAGEPAEGLVAEAGVDLEGIAGLGDERIGGGVGRARRVVRRHGHEAVKALVSRGLARAELRRRQRAELRLERGGQGLCAGGCVAITEKVPARRRALGAARADDDDGLEGALAQPRRPSARREAKLVGTIVAVEEGAEGLL